MSAKNILIILGGGRPNGNTAQLAEAFEQGAREAGHTVETISLLKNEVRGCLGCNACRYAKPCVSATPLTTSYRASALQTALCWLRRFTSGPSHRGSKRLSSAFTVLPKRTPARRSADTKNTRSRTVRCS